MKLFKGNIIASFVVIAILFFNASICIAGDRPQNISIAAGDYILFGRYYNEPILWRVINTDSEKIMLYSDKILCLKVFDAQSDDETARYGSNDWEKSSLRQWLNSKDARVRYTVHVPDKNHIGSSKDDYADEPGFLYNFAPQERDKIYSIKHKSIIPVKHKEFSEGGAEGHTFRTDIYDAVGNYDDSYYKQVEDKVFLLDVKEIKELVHDRGWSLNSKLTGGAVSNSKSGKFKGSFDYTRFPYNLYWLRTPVSTNTSGVRLIIHNTVSNVSAINIDIGVRPAVYLKSGFKISGGTGKENDPFIFDANGKFTSMSRPDPQTAKQPDEKKNTVKAGESTSLPIPDYNLETEFYPDDNFKSHQYRINHIISNKGTHIAVGNKVKGKYAYALILTSEDGTAWTERLADTKGLINSIACNEKKYVAVGTFYDGRAIFTSNDGINWTKNSYYSADSSLNNVVWDGQRFIASGYDHFLISTDGERWKKHTLGMSMIINGMAAGNGLIVAVGGINGEGSVITSADGIDWVKRSPATGSQLYDIVFNGEQFVAVGGGFESNAIISSRDGINWYKSRLKQSQSIINYITWKKDKYVALGSGKIYISKDGVSWAVKQIPERFYMFTGIFPGDDGFIITYQREGILKIKLSEVQQSDQQNIKTNDNEIKIYPHNTKTNRYILLKIGNSIINLINGNEKIKKRLCEGEDVSPVIYDERTYLPVRGLIETMGGYTEWSDPEQKITVKFNSNIIELWVNSREIVVNGMEKTMDASPLIVDGRLMLPARYLLENLGLKLHWDETNQVIRIDY